MHGYGWAAIFSLSETGWTTTNLRSFGNLDGQDIQACSWLGYQVSFSPRRLRIQLLKIDYTVQTSFANKRRIRCGQGAYCELHVALRIDRLLPGDDSPHIPIPIARATDTVSISTPFSSFRASIRVCDSPLGSGLPESQSDGRFLLKVVKRIVKQILPALDCVDRECGTYSDFHLVTPDPLTETLA